MTDLENREAFLYELNGLGYSFKNTTWLTGLGGNNGVFEDDQLHMAWEVWNASSQRQGFKLVPLEMSWQKADKIASEYWNRYEYSHEIQHQGQLATHASIESARLKWCKNKAHEIMDKYKAMIDAV